MPVRILQMSSLVVITLLLSLCQSSEAANLSHRDFWVKWSNLGGAAIQKGDYTKAKMYFEKALSIAKEFGQESEEMASSLNNLAGVYMQQDQWEEAEFHLMMALNTRKQVLQPTDVKLAHTLFNLGICCFHERRYTQAEHYIQRAIYIREQSEGKSSPRISNELAWLAKVYAKHGRLKDAESLLTRALRIRQQHYGKDDKRTMALETRLKALRNSNMVQMAQSSAIE